jgi:hypothetical protein
MEEPGTGRQGIEAGLPAYQPVRHGLRELRRESANAIFRKNKSPLV